jgi:hypothetical protein
MKNYLEGSMSDMPDPCKGISSPNSTWAESISGAKTMALKKLQRKSKYSVL